MISSGFILTGAERNFCRGHRKSRTSSQRVQHERRRPIHGHAGRWVLFIWVVIGVPPSSTALRLLSATASRLALGLGTGGCGQKLLPAAVAAKVERLSIAFGVERGRFVHGHAADRIFGHGFRFIHGVVSFFVCFCVVVVALLMNWR